MAFHVGQLVCCVGFEIDPKQRGLYSSWPVKGEVVTIRAILDDGVGLIFEEHINPDHPTIGEEMRFYSADFRPVTTRNQEIIASLLQPLPQKVDA